ncbi:MAG: hypothetical protein WBE92_02155 [Steroidobacteraceae bacterium]
MTRPPRRYIAISVLLLLAALTTSAAEAPSGQGPGQSQVAGRHLPSIAFSGQRFLPYKIQRIDNGWGAYYTIDTEHPDAAKDSIVVNHMSTRDGQGHVIEPEQLAHEMLDGVRSRGGTLITPFSVPDPSSPGRFTYYAIFYYVHAKDGYGEVWMSRVFQSKQGIIEILYRHTIDGSGPSVIETNIQNWLLQNVQARGSDLSNLAVPARPQEPDVR